MSDMHWVFLFAFIILFPNHFLSFQHSNSKCSFAIDIRFLQMASNKDSSYMQIISLHNCFF